MSMTITLEGAATSTGPGRKAYVPVTLAGRAAVGYIYTAGNAIDAETITIGPRVYEFDTAAAPGVYTAGRVRIDVNADQTPDYACAALAAAINGDADAVVDALAWVDNDDTASGVTLVARVEGAANFGLAEATTNFIVSAAATVGGDQGTVSGIGGGQYVVTAADVTALALAAGSGNEIPIGALTNVRRPTLIGLLCQTAAGVVKALATVTFTVRQVNGNFWALTVDDGAAVLAAGDVIGFTLAL